MLWKVTCDVCRVQANDNQFKQELAKVVGTELWDAAKAASADELKVRPGFHDPYLDCLAAPGGGLTADRPITRVKE